MTEIESPITNAETRMASAALGERVFSPESIQAIFEEYVTELTGETAVRADSAQKIKEH